MRRPRPRSIAIDSIRPTLEALPSARVGTYASQLAPPGFAEVESYLDIASALAFEVTKDTDALGRLSPCLAELDAGVDAATDECLGQWVERIAPRLLRAPLSEEKKLELLANYAVGGDDSAGDGVATLLIALLLDPRFLYFVEVNGEDIFITKPPTMDELSVVATNADGTASDVIGPHEDDARRRQRGRLRL